MKQRAGESIKQYRDREFILGYNDMAQLLWIRIRLYGKEAAKETFTGPTARLEFHPWVSTSYKHGAYGAIHDAFGDTMRIGG